MISESKKKRVNNYWHFVDCRCQISKCIVADLGAQIGDSGT